MGLKLDFTRLDRIATQGASKRPRKPIGDHTGESIQTPEKPPEVLYSGLQREVGKAAESSHGRERDVQEKALRIYQTYQENRAKSGQLQADLLKGIKAGEDPEKLLLKACEAVSLMTGNSLFYRQMEEDLVSVYGEGLLHPIPLQMELEGVRERVGRIEAALQRKGLEPDDRRRIEQALEAHREREKDIQGLLSQQGSRG